MPLPNLNRPIFEFILPVSKKVIKLQPYLVKHHKMLLMAVEGGNKKQILLHTIEVIKDCILGDKEFDILSLHYVDFEYLYIKLRSVSIDSALDVLIKCDHCGHQNPINVNLDKVSVQENNLKQDVKFGSNEEINVKLEHPSLGKLLHLSRVSDEETYLPEEVNKASENEKTYSVLMHIKEVSQGEQIYEFTEDELIEWGSQLVLKDWETIVNFSNNPPKVFYADTLKCTKCSKKTKYEIKGFNNFFG